MDGASEDLALEQAGTFASPRPLDRGPSGLVDGNDVVAVYRHARQAVGVGEGRHVGGGQPGRDRRVDRVLVVFADVDNRQLP